MGHTLYYLFLGYLILYVIFGIALFVLEAVFVPQEERKNEEPWETPLDIVLLVAGLAGMLFLFLNVQNHWLQLAWRPVSIALLLTQCWVNVRVHLKHKIAPEDERMAAFAEIGTLSFLAPSLILNLHYAFR